MQTAEYWRKYRGYPDAARPAPELCELCGDLPTHGKSLCSDHDHVTNQWRGWLCQKCNTGLGMFKDNPELFRKAALYIENNKNAGHCDIGGGTEF